MNVRVFATEQEAAVACAAHIAAEVRSKPDLVMGLPTGRSPINFYKELVASHRRGELDLSRATSFTLDEFLGVPPDDPASFQAYMERHLFRYVNLAPERTHFFDGSAPDAEAECARYDAAVVAAGGMDLVLLGIGPNGHIAFNEPGDSVHATSHRVLLSRETRQTLAPLVGDDVSKVPMAALTLGVAPLIQGKQVHLLAFGAGKAAAVTAMVHGPITPRCPASFLQLHRDVYLWLDPIAARGLQRR
ncbi:glucosamine-6-phosphate deaminase [Hyalangium versicolor]|uniref:glucosamine-6-phosphate deaminase n=1 Tax=Hyalangium versicolor TaxID=2861190 RepID=UPI001CCC1B0F|nr:glucosamine-6-phosphate deaminase [Hyalangium versicolor]